MGRKLGTGGSASFWGKGTGSPSNTTSLGLRPTSVRSSILIHPAIWPQQIWAENWGEDELGPNLAQCRLGRDLPPSLPSDIVIHPSIWPQQIWAENWGLSLWWRGAGSPSSTMWPGPRPTSTPSGILIHPAVWPKQTQAKNCRLCPLWEGGAESPSNTSELSQGPPACQVSS